MNAEKAEGHIIYGGLETGTRFVCCYILGLWKLTLGRRKGSAQVDRDLAEVAEVDDTIEDRNFSI